MPVVSVKVDERTKREMAKYHGEIEWPEEIRAFIAGRIEQMERQKTATAVRKLLEEAPTLPRGTASRLVREDRDAGH